MVRTFLVTVSLYLGWMLSADVLVRLGNGVGTSRTLFLASLAGAALLAALANSIIRHPGLRHNGSSSLVGTMAQGLGRWPTMTLALASRISLALLLPTGLLVTAGFTFNEVFVYWFPNFGFSFLLLGTICTLHLIGRGAAIAVQPVFTGVALLAMFVLCLAGLGGAAASPMSVDIGFSFSAPVLLGSMLLFLGIDQGSSSRASVSRLPGFGALFIALLLFIFWSMLSLQHVGGERLAGSTIPHMTAAREILGQPGRLIMGVAVISSTCALVNMLFHMVTNTLAELAERNLLPGHPPGRLKRRRFVLVITLMISALLMGGLAGYEVLETYIQAALILWLLHTGCNCLAAGRILRQNATPGGLYGIALGLFYLLVSLYLAISAQDPTTLTRFLLIMLFTTAISSLLWLRKGPVVEVIQHNSQGDLS